MTIVFDKDKKAIVELLDEEEARVFILFLESEVYRHQKDIDETTILIDWLRHKFNDNSKSETS